MYEPVTAAPTIRIVSWNLAAGSPGVPAKWADVAGNETADVALLQEAPNPWYEATTLQIVPEPGTSWGITGSRAQTAVARLSDRVSVTELRNRPLGSDGPLELAISRPGTVTAATVTVNDTGEQILVVSVYAQWETDLSGQKRIFADASMHRILSDLTPLLSWRTLPVIVAGDFNCILGDQTASSGGNWIARNESVFQRFGALGLRLAGPQATEALPAEARPLTLPANSRNVTTFQHRYSTGSGQLDYCYVTEELAHRVTVRALNSPDEWGPSDHCRLEIDVAPPTDRLWTRSSFLAELEVAHSRDCADVAGAVLDWAGRHGLDPIFTPGQAGQVWIAIPDAPGGLAYSFALRASGDVVIGLQYLPAPYKTPAAQEELRLRLNEIEGVFIDPDRIGGRPTFPIRLLADPAALDAFTGAFETVVADVRAMRP